MKSISSPRRRFIKMASMAVAALAVPLAATTTRAQSSSLGKSTTMGMAEVIAVTVRSDLFSPPKSLVVYPSTWSNPIDLPGRGKYRVRVVPQGVDPRFGEKFALILGNANAKEIGRMNVGNSTTATFGSFGIQVYLVSLHVSSDAEAAALVRGIPD